MRNYDYICYTYLHRKVFETVAKKYVTNEADRREILERAKKHDLDKILLYLHTDKNTAHNYHRESSNHHLSGSKKFTYSDYLEAVIDWDCARYTKADKPLNAYDTLYKYYPAFESEILPILEKLGLASPSLPPDEDIAEQVKNLTCSEEKISDEINLLKNNYTDRYNELMSFIGSLNE